MMFVVRFILRLVEIGRCRHEFRWQPVEGERLDQLICDRCGITYHWEAWH